MEIWISISGIFISVLSLILVLRQIKISTKTIRSQIATDLVYKLYTNNENQNLLEKIYRGRLEFNDITKQIYSNKDEEILSVKVDRLLNQFQILGHLFDLQVIKGKDLSGLKYEIISIGRNEAIRKYLKFLNGEYQQESGIRHEHFNYFSNIYIIFEYDKAKKDSYPLNWSKTNQPDRLELNTEKSGI